MECIVKASRKRYEFGCKVAIVTTSEDPLVVSIFAAHGNLYDGHTLRRSIKQSEKLTHIKVQDAFMVNAILTGCAFNLRKIMRLIQPSFVTI